MDAKRRNFFASIVQQSKHLSECRNPKAAIIVRGEGNFGIGFNKPIFPGKTEKTGESREYKETYPIFDAIRCRILGSYPDDDGQKVRGFGETGSVAFLTYFPHIEELKLLYQENIHKIYFFGDIDDEDSVNFMNDLTYNDKFIGDWVPFFEIIQLN
jgi:hypothetical protein